MSRPDPKRPTLPVALAIYALATFVFLWVTGPARLATHTPFNHFALLADAWWHGRLDLAHGPPAYAGNNDFALYAGKTYVSFPPFPAVLLVPFVALAGRPELVRDGLVFGCLTGVAPALVFVALERLEASGRSALGLARNALLALGFAFGTVYFFTAVQGTVWFAAHVVGAALAAAFVALSVGAAHPLAAGVALGLAFATRTPLAFAAPFFVHEALCAARPPGLARAGIGRVELPRLARTLAPFALGAGAVVALLLWHNHARFGDPLEFGHRYLQITWRARIDKYGLFSSHYLGRNLGIVFGGLPFLHREGVPFQINAHGLALWITTPAFAWALWPRRATSTWRALAVTALAVALPSLLYQNSGWIQFGYRFSNDFAVFVTAMVATGRRKLGPWFWCAVLAGVAVNTFGAATFQRAGWEKFYFVDGSQRVVWEPD